MVNNLNQYLSSKLTEHKTVQWYMTLEIQVLSWDSDNNVAVLNWLMRSQSSPFDNWISKCNKSICKR